MTGNHWYQAASYAELDGLRDEVDTLRARQIAAEARHLRILMILIVLIGLAVISNGVSIVLRVAG